jgi:hypothetical protein
MRGRSSLAIALVTICAWLMAVGPASAWSRPGHMVTAAIAYQELMATDPKVVDRILAIMASHPEPGPFQVAIGRATGVERAQRIFLEIPRWPDDIRGSEYDHPTWHYLIRPVTDPASPPPHAAPYVTSGSAVEALALNISVARNPRASQSERAIALCWIFHIVGDVHQPLHAAEMFSRQWPDGDFAGDKIFLVDPHTGETVKLHWFWDDSVHQAAEPDAALARARQLTAQFPRAHFARELARDAEHPADSGAWTMESFAVARSVGYRADGPRAPTPGEARPLARAYAADSVAAAEQRLTLAGYRLADVLRAAFPAP